MVYSRFEVLLNVCYVIIYLNVHFCFLFHCLVFYTDNVTRLLDYIIILFFIALIFFICNSVTVYLCISVLHFIFIVQTSVGHKEFLLERYLFVKFSIIIVFLNEVKMVI